MGASRFGIDAHAMGVGEFGHPAVVFADSHADLLSEVGEKGVGRLHVVHDHAREQGEPGDGIVAEVAFE